MEMRDTLCRLPENPFTGPGVHTTPGSFFGHTVIITGLICPVTTTTLRQHLAQLGLQMHNVSILRLSFTISYTNADVIVQRSAVIYYPVYYSRLSEASTLSIKLLHVSLTNQYN